jgi:hypothetical protein
MEKFEDLLNFGENTSNDISFTGQMQALASQKLRVLLHQSRLKYFSKDDLVKADHCILLIVGAGYSMRDHRLLDKINASIQGECDKYKWFVLPSDDLDGYNALCAILPAAVDFSAMPAPWLLEFRQGTLVKNVFTGHVYSSVDFYLKENKEKKL